MAAAGIEAAGLPLDAHERVAVAPLGPWPPSPRLDPGNRVSGDPNAIALGEQLFHSPRLGTSGALRCASCHEPWRGFADGRPRGLGLAPGDRNTPSLYNTAASRWFGWDGANDTLWGQSIRPLLAAHEMGASASHVARALRENAAWVERYRTAFGRPLPTDDEALLVDVGKALAAYQETLVSPRTPFDAFRDALLAGDTKAAAAYPPAARRGLAIFVGRGGCVACHAGPRFTDDAFHRSSIRSRLHSGEPDTGRAGALPHLAASPYRARGPFDDRGPSPAGVPAAAEAAAPNAFRTPGLREVAATPPYMHDGSVRRLCDALRPHAAEQRAPALGLADRRDLVAFLRTLGAQPDPPFAEADAWRCRR